MVVLYFNGSSSRCESGHAGNETKIASGHICIFESRLKDHRAVEHHSRFKALYLKVPRLTNCGSYVVIVLSEKASI